MSANGASQALATSGAGAGNWDKRTSAPMTNSNRLETACTTIPTLSTNLRGQREGVGSRWKTKLAGHVIRGAPDRLGHIRLGRHGTWASEGVEDWLCEGLVGRRDGLVPVHIRVSREARCRPVAWFDQLDAHLHGVEFKCKRAGETLDRRLACGIDRHQREGRQRRAR